MIAQRPDGSRLAAYDLYLEHMQSTVLGLTEPDHLVEVDGRGRRNQLIRSAVRRAGFVLARPQNHDLELIEQGRVWPKRALTMVGRSGSTTFATASKRCSPTTCPATTSRPASGVAVPHSSRRQCSPRTATPSGQCGWPTRSPGFHSRRLPRMPSSTTSPNKRSSRRPTSGCGTRSSGTASSTTVSGSYPAGSRTRSRPSDRRPRRAPLRRRSVRVDDGHVTAAVSEGAAGGFVIVDDYGIVEACKVAVDEYRAQQGIGDPLVDIDGWGWYWRKT